MKLAQKMFFLALILASFLGSEASAVGIVRRRGSALPPVSRDFQGMQAEACRDGLKEKPDDPRLHTCIAVDAMQKKNWEEAVEHWEKTIQIHGGVGEVGHIVNLASSYLNLGKPDQAREQVEQALQFNPKSIRLHFWLASFWATNHDKEKMQAAYQKILPLASEIDSPQERYYLALAILETGSESQFPEAEEALKTFLSINPKHYPGWTSLGFLSLKMGKAEEGLKALKTGEALKPDHLPIQLLLAQAYLSMGDSDAAILHGSEVLKRIPGHLTANYLVGTAFLRKGNQERGIEHLNRAASSEGGMGNASLLLGKTYLSEGRLKEARTVLEALARKSPEDSAVQLAFIRLLIQAGQAEEAIQTADRALKKSPDNKVIQTLKASALLHLQKFSETEILLAEILHQDETFLPAQVERIRLYQVQKKLDLALRAVAQLIKTRPEHPIGYEMKGNLALAQGDLALAITTFKKLVEIKPDHLQTWMKLFTLQAQGRNFQGAQESAEQMIKHFPRLQEGYFAKGIALLQQKKETVAEAFFEKVIDLNGKHYKAHNYLALIASKSSPEKAILHYEASLRALPKQPSIYVRLASLYLSVKKKESGLQLAREFIGQYPDQGGPHLLIGMLSLEEQREEGILHLKKAIRLEPKTAAFYLNLGSIYEQEGAREKTIAFYETALQNIPDHPIFLNNLAWNYAEINRTTEALPLAIKAEKMRPKDWTIKDTLGWIYYKEKDYQAAISKLKEALVINDQHPSLQYHIALAYLARKEEAIALKHLKKAAHSAMPFPEKEEVRRLIESLEK